MCRTEILIESVARAALFILILLSTPYARCTSVGSNTQPSREQFWLLSGAGNTINRFAGLYNGFSLVGNTSSVTFNSCFPVGTTMSLQGGTLTLLQNLFLASNLIFGSPGTIIGNNNLVEFAPHDQIIELPYLGQLNILTSQNAGGAVNASYVSWSPDGKYVAAATAPQSGSIPELVIYSFNGSTLTQVAGLHLGMAPSTITWQPIITAPPSYYLVSGSNLSGSYAYQFTPPSTLIVTSTVATGTPFQGVAFHPSGNLVAVAAAGVTTQQIMLYNFSAGTLTFNTSYSVPSLTVFARSMQFDPSGTYLAAGFNSGGNSLQILHWDGISLTSATSINPGAGVSAVRWSPDGSLLAIGLNGTSQRLQIYSFNRSLNTLTLLPSYNVGESGTVSSIDWSLDGHTLVYGTNLGSIQLYAVNTIGQRLLSLTGYNQGQYEYAVRWSPNNIYLGTAINSGFISIFNLLGGSMNLQSISVVFNSPVQLRGSIICSGPCVIDCNGFSLDLNSQTITVTSGSSLLLTNAVLEGFNGANIQCVDNTGTVSFQNVNCIVNNAMQWSQGNLAIIGDCTMTGTGKFIYSANQPCTISSGMQWTFDRGMTFSYYPQGSAKNLINFADNTAQLYLYETALHAQPTGLQFTKGTLDIEGRCPFYSDASTMANGILFGDNGSSVNNINLVVLPESGIDCRSGYVVDQNVGG